MSAALRLADLWGRAVEGRNPARVVQLYTPDAVLVGTVAQRIKVGRDAIRTYFNSFLRKPGLRVVFKSSHVQQIPYGFVDSGTYVFHWTGQVKPVVARFTFVWVRRNDRWMLLNHHSSALPE